MDRPTRRLLEAINRRFYAERAHDFDSSRSRPWQGWSRALAGLPIATPAAPLRVLDLGCGNGRLLAHLASERHVISTFVGTDSCAPLIELARARYAGAGIRFERAELFDDAGLPALPDGLFDVVALMGVLHHVPDEQARRALVHAAFERVAPGGRLVLTVWRFENDSRLSKRKLPWPESIAGDPALAALELEQLEPGDTLLAWNKGERGVRYCHAIDREEIARWLHGVRASVDRFHADGEGELNEYVVLARE